MFFLEEKINEKRRLFIFYERLKFLTKLISSYKFIKKCIFISKLSKCNTRFLLSFPTLILYT